MWQPSLPLRISRRDYPGFPGKGRKIRKEILKVVCVNGKGFNEKRKRRERKETCRRRKMGVLDVHRYINILGRKSSASYN